MTLDQFSPCVFGHSSLRSCPNLSHVANVERGPPLTNLTIYFTFCGTCSHPSPIARRFCSSIALGTLFLIQFSRSFTGFYSKQPTVLFSIQAYLDL